MSTPLPSIAAAKAEAKRLRAELRVNATELSHSESLERLAHRHGFRDWNGLSAAIAAQSSKGFTPGGRVQGRYLSQPFTATIRNTTMLWPGWFRLRVGNIRSFSSTASAIITSPDSLPNFFRSGLAGQASADSSSIDEEGVKQSFAAGWDE
jgi:hypothetical protein